MIDLLIFALCLPLGTLVTMDLLDRAESWLGRRPLDEAQKALRGRE
jgi:hypothetical protein